MGNPRQWLGRMKMALLALGIGTVAWGCGGGSSAPTPDPAASITSILPRSAPAGSLAFTLSVTGSNFVSTSTVEWNGNSRTTTLVSSTQLQAHIMAADMAAPGTATVTVVNSALNAGKSNASTFTIAPATIALLADRALDGSDALNSNSASNIWLMSPDGVKPTPLTKLTALILTTDQAWSPDGSKVAYASSRALNGIDVDGANHTSNIWLVNADGSNSTPLTKVTAFSAHSFSPAWSPDGSKIAFNSSRALDGSDANGLSTNIWVINADGSNLIPLTKVTALANSSRPGWSPDGSKIAFESGRALDGSNAPNSNSTSNIWMINADGSKPIPLTKLTAGGADSLMAVWSPDGSKIAFRSGRALDGSDALNTNFVNNIWVMNADGSNAIPLTKLTAANVIMGSAPAWSPDGSKIAFNSSRALDGSNANSNAINIWVINEDGSNPSPLTKLTAGSTSGHPIWSPDGSKIFFDSNRVLDGSDAINVQFRSNIWVVNADGTNPAPLTKLTAADCALPQQP